MNKIIVTNKKELARLDQNAAAIYESTAKTSSAAERAEKTREKSSKTLWSLWLNDLFSVESYI